ncbi:hypothetical protein [Vallitalea longa]|uniref:lysine 5,6-aminomutase reactivase subunit KamB n=1 Tax=Vallitalea longa TaxID=2936439 RepID=UPI0024902E36|nr:hypothetical protein [Vallitalea longa]
MTKLFQRLTEYNSISIIGMDKNVGKTTTLNFIINKARGIYTLGLTSIGRDGEEKDMVTGTKKPRIYVSRNTYIATAKKCIISSDVTKEVIDTTGINTPIGEIVIIKSLSDGYIELAGPSLNTYMKEICMKLSSYGCDYVLCDGAVSRKTFASPVITDATILCTGASVSNDIRRVACESLHTITLLSINKNTDDKLKKTLKNNERCKVCLVTKDYELRDLNILTSLEASGDIVNNLDKSIKYIVIRGIISDRLILGIIGNTELYRDIAIIVEDGTKLFLSKKVYDIFTRSGGTIEGLNKINVVGVSVNPVSPYGYEFDKGKLESIIKEGTELPVFNVYDAKIS